MRNVATSISNSGLIELATLSPHLVEQTSSLSNRHVQTNIMLACKGNKKG